MFQPMRGSDTQQSSMFSYLSPEERVPANHPFAADSSDGRRRLEVIVPGLQPTLLSLRAAVDSSGEVAASIAFTGVVYGSQRTNVDGTIGIQPALSVVCWPEHGRNRMGADGVHQESGPAFGR